MLTLLDYGKPNTIHGVIGRPCNLAWPVNVYRVTLPKISNNKGLNAFERVILKLLDVIGVMGADELADETRIPLDLVKSILLRLQDKMLIDEYHNIIRQDKDAIKQDEYEITSEFVTALLFRELVTGKILPFLHLMDEANPLQQKERDKKDYRIINGVVAHKKNMPTQRDVINALETMEKRAVAFGMEGKKPILQQITIAAEPQFYYLDCSIVIQSSDSEFRIVDPFGTGFSLILEKAFDKLLEQHDSWAEWLLSWKQRLRNTSAERQSARTKELFDTDANMQRYPELISSLKNSSNQRFRGYVKIHASIEWALFYACCIRPFTEIIETLKFTKPEHHSDLLIKSAQAIGLEPPPQGFRPIREGKLRDFEYGKADQETVLAIAMLQACDDTLHPLRRVASIYPDLIKQLLNIKAERNKKAHGKGGADIPHQKLTVDSFMCEVVHILVPRIFFSPNTSVALPDGCIQVDEMLDARASIQAEFGFHLFNRLGINLQERLVHAERFFLACHDGDDASIYIGDLYAAAHATLDKILVGKLPPDVADTQLIGMAESKAIAFKLCKVLPENLITVKVLTIRQTLQGRSQSLGACVIALLLVSEEGVLTTIHDTMPTFIADMANLIMRRGHGNEPIYLPRLEIAKIRKTVLSTIKTLLEY